MKKQLLLVFTLLTGSLAYAQAPLDSFFRKGARFSAGEKVPAGFGTSWDAHYIFLLDSDTVVNGSKYIVVRDASRDSMNIMGLIRTEGEKVYYRKTGIMNHYGLEQLGVLHMHLQADTDVLLYDFGIQKGDTVHWRTSQPYFKPDSVIVQDVDTVILHNGSPALRYIFSRDSTGAPYDYWVRGVGSSASLFGAFIAPGSIRSFCYTSGYERYGFWGLLCFPASIHDAVAGNEIVLEVFPNPVPGTNARLKLAKDAVALQVYDMHGRLVIHENKFKAGIHDIVVPAVPGMYLLVVTLDDGSRNYTRFQKL